MGADRASGRRQRCARSSSLAAVALIDDSTRPRLVVTGPELTPAQRAQGEHLVLIHDMYRGELARVRDLLARAARGSADPADLRGMVADLSMRRTYESLGAFCARFCAAVQVHHRIEDAHMFASLRPVSTELGEVLERLSEEHEVIGELLSDLDARIVAMVDDPGELSSVRDGLERLAEALLSHLAYEEEQLVDPLGRFGIVV